jgi:hypothetical protein
MIPGNFYAYSFAEKPTSLKEAKEMVRKFLGVNRLPNGTQIW